ncbi:MAG TPA: ATP-binding protein [Opitutaceae bacterium]|nr:ATP-binding protein [Opitutaceae bacterium]
MVFAVALCVALALIAERGAKGTLRRLAGVELEAARLAREFRGAVDDLHGALLRIGTESADDSAAVIQQRRDALTRWIAARRAAAAGEEEERILQRLDQEVQSYLLKLDALQKRPGGFSTRLERDEILMFDDSAVRLQSMADDFAAVHDAGLRDLLQASLQSVLRLRNLVLICLVLLIAAIGVVVRFLYRDVVRPLRVQLVERDTLLAKREKLAALGTLAAGVAHEIRNPLTAIKARLYTLRRSASAPEAVEDMDAIGQELTRLERIVREVLGYARPAEPNVKEVELAGWLKEFSAFIKPDLDASHIELTLETPEPVVASIDTDQMRQVMLNLIRNAQEAFNDRPGRIVLSVHRQRSMLRNETRDVAVLDVTDNGPGISADVQERLFDPFFTTKATGTGLGLPIVARLVEQHGGEIAFQSGPGAGTRFSVRLPAVPSRGQNVGA